MTEKFITILEEVVTHLNEGKTIPGTIFINPETGKLEFKAFNKRNRKRHKDKLICHLEHGWVKESKEKIKVFESIDKALGVGKINEVISRETEDAKSHINDWGLIESI